jgi:uncharacterized protein (DUF362 family)
LDTNNINIIYGNNPKEMVKALLEDANIKINKNYLVGLKPNLVVSKEAKSGATTTPEIVEGIIEYLKDKGIINIVIIEGSWVGDNTTHAYKVCGYDKISEKYDVPLYDLQKDSYKTYYSHNMGIDVCDKAMEVDYMINIPVLKGHCQTNVTCALKNMKGCITDREKRKFHTMGLNKPIAYLNSIIKQNLIIVDAMNGDLTFEEGGTPVEMNRIIMGRDPVLIDSYVCELMGYNLDDVPYIKAAENLGVGSSNLKNTVVKEINKADNNIINIANTGYIYRLTNNVIQDCACSACFGSLVHALKRLDEKGQIGIIKDRLFIGQAFMNKKRDGIGIGTCTKNFTKNIKGCPPKAIDIIKELIKYNTESDIT